MVVADGFIGGDEEYLSTLTAWVEKALLTLAVILLFPK